MPYKISGNTNNNFDIIILNNNGTVDVQQSITSGEYEVETTTSGSKIVIARAASGESYGFSNVESLYAPPAFHSLILGLDSGMVEYKVGASSVDIEKSSTYFSPVVAGIVYEVEFSTDNQYLAVGEAGPGPNGNTLSIYKYNSSDESYTSLSVPVETRGILNMAWSPDNTYLAYSCPTLPIVNILKRTGDTFVKLSNPPVGPDYTAGPPPVGPIYYGDMAWHPNGDILILSLAYLPAGNTDRFWVYKRTGDTFSIITTPFSGGTRSSTSSGAAFSSVTGHLALSSSSLSVYERSGDQFVILADTLGWPTVNSIYDLAYSPDGTYLAVCAWYDPQLYLFKWTGSAYIQLSVPASPRLNGQAVSVDWSSDGKYLALGGYGNFLMIYERDGDTLTTRTISNAPTMLVRSVNFTK